MMILHTLMPKPNPRSRCRHWHRAQSLVMIDRGYHRMVIIVLTAQHNLELKIEIPDVQQTHAFMLTQ